jgi:hypothetical protein
MKRLLAVLTLAACAGLFVGCGDTEIDKAEKAAAEKAKAEMMKTRGGPGVAGDMMKGTGTGSAKESEGTGDKAEEETGAATEKEADEDAGKAKQE